jgi:hypothetical protein
MYRPMVREWRARFAEYRLDGMIDEPRPGITYERVEQVIARKLESTSRHATHWSTRSMAAEVGLTQWAVHRIWCALARRMPAGSS